MTERRPSAGQSVHETAPLRPSRRPPARDMDATSFAQILDRSHRCACPARTRARSSTSAARPSTTPASSNPFDVKVAAAHMRIVLNDLDEYGALGRPRWVVLRGEKRSFVARSLPEGYALVVMLRRRAGFTASARAYAACERELAAEAGLEPPAAKGRPGFPSPSRSTAAADPREIGPPHASRSRSSAP